MEEHVRAAVRVKPSEEEEPSCLKIIEGSRVRAPARDGKGHATFAVDRVFDETASQEAVLEWVKPAIVDVASKGLNATVFAYGQTGSGKSHTMGFEAATLFGPDAGLVPRAAEALFDALAATRRSLVHCSFLQIYGDKVLDLLATDDTTNLVVRESRSETAGFDHKRIFVQGLSEYQVTSAADVLGLVARGLRGRATRPTDMNSRSSRSHAILQVAVEVETACSREERRDDDDDDDDDEWDRASLDSAAASSPVKQRGGGRTVLRRAKLCLVDLAGSEKWSPAATADAELAAELKAINRSLSALGNCFAALCATADHVPYRDSTLTRLLEDALGGRALVIATVAAGRSSLEETVSTLAFAQRAKNIKARLRFDEVVNDAVLLKRARREIARLRRERHHHDARRDRDLEEARAAAAAAPAERALGKLCFELDVARDRAAAADAAATAAIAASTLLEAKVDPHPPPEFLGIDIDSPLLRDRQKYPRLGTMRRAGAATLKNACRAATEAAAKRERRRERANRRGATTRERMHHY
ncbi:hypothetical protein CTAYLR_001424 [Chrysophaeum taylorii]|uniref:Kinesin-like protein n=1 Tax=Chrysophaeum taylorii TaxID=2483200 RepID=A0AAD7U9M0_9STRA|nr:hypothetical protein CTAYLR_001424 [Chrysophaeum taylorii]